MLQNKTLNVYQNAANAIDKHKWMLRTLNKSTKTPKMAEKVEVLLRMVIILPC